MRVLLVEDDQALAATLVMGLEAAAYEVTAATTLAEAAALVAAGPPPELAVVDVNLPDGVGFSLIPILRDAGCLVVVLTARTNLDDRLRAFSMGADDYVPKPFSFDELVARLGAVSRRPGPARPLVLRYGDLELDLESHRTTRAGQPLDLTAREFAILQVLLRSVPRVVHREVLFHRIWGYRSDLGGGILDVYISHLRRKLERSGPRILHTVRGVGFVLRQTPDQ